jgi:hypothetical protein
MKTNQNKVNAFAAVPQAEIPRSSFDRSSSLKTAIDAGILYPFFVDEVVPGDTFNLQTSGFCRMATPIFPVMDNMYLETFYFFVPNRLVWTNWQKFMGEQEDPDDSTDYVVPRITGLPGGVVEGSLGDHLGIPTKIPNLSVNALPIRAYHLIWNEWFRDQNLQDSFKFSKGDGPDQAETTVFPFRRGKRHDYFTSCLPWPQKGPSIEIPLGIDAPIKGLGILSTATFPVSTSTNVYETQNKDQLALGTTPTSTSWPVGAYTATANTLFVKAYQGTNPDTPHVRADLRNADAGTINELRQAFQLQRMSERDARGGTRYTEIVRSHFGVTSPDARLQRPEYLGGGHVPININPIYSTAETQDATLGRLSGVGIGSFTGHGFTKSFTEHGYVIGLVNVRADISYQQGLDRMWKRSTKHDFYWPALAHIGEQAVLSGEIYTDGTANDETVFGYQERYAEMRYKPSRVTDIMRSNATQSLDAWHLAQEFSERPLLNGVFIQDNPPVDRVITTPSERHFICDFYHKLICARPMPMYGTPGMADHF